MSSGEAARARRANETERMEAKEQEKEQKNQDKGRQETERQEKGHYSVAQVCKPGSERIATTTTRPYVLVPAIAVLSCRE